ncbi:uncharacterized protein FA14DRAFT_176249 [Meira miltonrushii]|uniref:Hydrophobin n=1 Tax=Meira miltonrushii TaxID=1280837 RepID=A0A316VHC5_9BASI|nr:uncharacterized protein FA14DRAFT_176249 [Meira miltonrushii]PWN36946.1 hypothetical protein FA14DRAFT_176249 [Meira miltonrushii]
MRFFTYFFLAYVAVLAVCASDYNSIKQKVDAIHSECQGLGNIPTGGITISGGAIIHADLQGVINVIVEAKAEIVAFVGVLTVVEVQAIVAVLAEIEVLLSVCVNLLLTLEVGLDILGLGGQCGQDLLDLNISVQAFIEAFLGIIPSGCHSCQSSAWNVCNQLGNTCTSGCHGYGYC